MSLIFKRSGNLFRSIKFLADVLRKDSDDSRNHVTRIRVEKDGSAVATNGMALHFVNVSGLEPGYYKPVKNRKTVVELVRTDELETHDYPDYASVLEGYRPGHMAYEDIEVVKDDGSFIFAFYTKLVRGMPSDSECTYNWFLFEPAITFFDDRTVNVAYQDDDHPLFIQNTDGIAVIMPRRI